MPTVVSAQPRLELRPFVRAYAQRVCDPHAIPVMEFVPAQLEQVINFEFGTMPGVRHQNRLLTDVVLLGGAQSSFSGYLELRPGVESFAIFFQPAGFSALFGVPLSTLSNHFDDATAIDPGFRSMWNRLGELKTFASRVSLVEHYLLGRDSSRGPRRWNSCRRTVSLSPARGGQDFRAGPSSWARAATVRTEVQAGDGSLPKAFARVARFQAALDAKAASPKRTWLDISHSFGYYDQMHMVHDFESLGLNTPTNVIAQMGDVRPTALITERESKQEMSTGRRD